MKTRSSLLVASASMVGAIVGVGVFGVPYAVSKVGWGLALAFFIVLTGIQLFQHLFYAEAAIATDDQVRLVGLTERFIGKRYRPLASVALLLGSWSSLIAYVLVGGDFLHALLGGMLGGSVIVYQLAWAALGSFMLFFGLAFVSRIGFVGTIGKVAAMLVILGLCAFRVKLGNFSLHVEDPLLPYGVIMFSLSGAAIVPEIEEMVGGDRRKYRLAVVIGTLVSAALTMLFGFMVYGVTGAATTPDAIAGLKSVLGGGLPVVAAAFGFLAVATSFLSVGIDLKDTIIYDFKFKPVLAWLTTMAVPVGFLAVGARNFLPIVSFSGAVFGGTIAMLISAMFLHISGRKLLGEDSLKVPHWVAYVVMLVLASGILLELGTSAWKLVERV
jgi:amino acid permease